MASNSVPGSALGVHYLDHAATTPMVPAAIEAMTAVLGTVGNASSLHGSGRSARRRVEEARESIAAAVGARPSEVIFTSGGTESDNLAIKGIFWHRRDEDARRRVIIASAVEHHAVTDTVEWLAAHEGAEVVWLPVDAEAVVDVAALRELLARRADEIALVTVMWANNEVGTIEPIADVVAAATEYGVPVHTDAIQAVGHLPVDYAGSGVGALSLAAHKFGGPTGVGALLLGREVGVVPLAHGGGHERDVRSGTPDTAAIVAMAAALTGATAGLDEERARVRQLRDALIDGVRAIDPTAILNGPEGPGRLDTNAHFTFPGCEGDSLLMLLDAARIECSTGSACTAGVARPSHVLLAMGVDPRRARGSLRFTLGHTSTEDDVAALLTALPSVLDRARAAGRMAMRDNRALTGMRVEGNI